MTTPTSWILHALKAFTRPPEREYANGVPYEEPETDEILEDYMCPNCVTPWKCNGPHILGHYHLGEFLNDD